jgi:hypothetical protein
MTPLTSLVSRRFLTRLRHPLPILSEISESTHVCLYFPDGAAHGTMGILLASPPCFSPSTSEGVYLRVRVSIFSKDAWKSDSTCNPPPALSKAFLPRDESLICFQLRCTYYMDSDSLSWSFRVRRADALVSLEMVYARVCRVSVYVCVSVCALGVCACAQASS